MSSKAITPANARGEAVSSDSGTFRLHRTAFFAAALVVLAGPPAALSAGENDIARISLSFGKGREVRIIPRGDSLTALAEIIVTGAGSVHGTWEVAGPLGPQDRNVFYGTVGEIEEGSSGESLLLESPALPSRETGSYAVRLSVAMDDRKRKIKVIKYFVGERPSRDLLSGRTEVPEVLASVNPPPEKKVTTSSILSWDPVPGSLAYQVELFDKTGDEQGIAASRVNACIIRLSSSLNRPPLVGLMVPAYRTETSIGELSVGVSLTEENTYLWRVVAMDRDGKTLCESPLREFRFGRRP